MYLHGESPEGEGLEVDGNTVERYRSSKSTIELFIVKKPESFIKKKNRYGKAKSSVMIERGGKHLHQRTIRTINSQLSLRNKGRQTLALDR